MISISGALIVTRASSEARLGAEFHKQILGNSQPIMLAGGVLVGSAAWWILLAMIAGAFRSRLNYTHMLWINLISGGMLTVLGAAGVVGGLMR